MHIFTIDADLYVCKFAHIITSKKEPIYAQETEKDKVLEIGPHISLLVNAKFDIDEKLRALSSLLFEIDIESKQTIEILAKNGSLNEYQLGQSGYRYNLTRDSVRRRIVGTTSKISLEKENFIVVTKSNKFRTKKDTKKFGLTFKGILASLSRINFEQNYSSRNFYQIINELTNNRFNIVDFAILFAKYHIALIMYWYKMMGFNFTRQTNLEGLFVEGMTNEILYGKSSKEISPDDWTNFVEIGKTFFVLQHILTTIIIKITKSNKSEIFTNDKIKHLIDGRPEYNDKKELRRLLMRYTFVDWFLYLSISTSTPFTVDDLLVIDYTRGAGGHGYVWLTLETKMNDLATKILNEIGLINKQQINVGEFELKPR